MAAKEGLSIPVLHMRPRGDERHGLATQSVLDSVGAEMRPKQGMVSLAEYLRTPGSKPRSTEGGAAGLNSHFEDFIVKDGAGIHVTSLGDLQHKLAEVGSPVEILGVESIGNNNQRVSAVVQGVNSDNPTSGYERPTVAEGPHMILAPYAFDGGGRLHLFRTIQYRTGEAVIDTPRGFADATALESGEQMYDVEGSGNRVQGNMKRVLGEEGGQKFLDIKKVVYLGAPRVNSSFVTSKSALFGVEVDYESFVQSSNVITQDEMQRRKEAEDHEGLTGVVLDMTAGEYVNFKRDSEIARDLAADSPADIVVMDWLEDQLELAKRQVDSNAAQAAQLDRDALTEVIAMDRLNYSCFGTDEGNASFELYRRVRADVPVILDLMEANPEIAFRKRVPSSEERTAA